MRVIIIQGAYRYRPDGEKSAVVVQLGDPAFNLPADEAARLVSLGVAKYAQEAVATAPPGDDKPPAGENPPSGNEGGKVPPEGDKDAPEYGPHMTVAELKAFADARNIPYEDKTTKAKLLEAIAAADEVGIDDGEAPPKPSVQDPVQ